jgi:hypothetical protein
VPCAESENACYEQAKAHQGEKTKFEIVRFCAHVF